MSEIDALICRQCRGLRVWREPIYPREVIAAAPVLMTMMVRYSERLCPRCRGRGYEPDAGLQLAVMGAP